MAQKRATQRRVRTAGGGYDIAVEAPPGNHEEHAAHDARAAKNDEDAGDGPPGLKRGYALYKLYDTLGGVSRYTPPFGGVRHCSQGANLCSCIKRITTPSVIHFLTYV
jgi:hypothetical protein